MQFEKILLDEFDACIDAKQFNELYEIDVMLFAEFAAMQLYGLIFHDE